MNADQLAALLGLLGDLNLTITRQQTIIAMQAQRIEELEANQKKVRRAVPE